jgi:phosphoenolpyruvate synthase/pyruvate phosphate dikinase
MTQLGIPVPPGINIPTEYCFEYLKLGKLPDDFIVRLKTYYKDWVGG